jgi:hypothetical protein
MLKTVNGTVNKQMHTTGGYLMLKTVRGVVKKSTDGRLMYKTVRGAANINYCWMLYS